MADTETKETKVVSTPEKKVVEEKKEESAPVCEKPKVVEKKVVEAENDEDSKASENGTAEEEATANGVAEKEATANGANKEKEAEEKEETNGTVKESSDVCSLKRKSTGGEEVDAAPKDVTSPKKAKLDDKPAAAPVEAEANGEA